mmetsp:Transcript_6727/g.15609  ORF Transcript_6727/g.15609 Transcript_6727/m.15609 type:complete len:109 (+) Transcript_6727:507-833(+)
MKLQTVVPQCQTPLTKRVTSPRLISFRLPLLRTQQNSMTRELKQAISNLKAKAAEFEQAISDLKAKDAGLISDRQHPEAWIEELQAENSLLKRQRVENCSSARYALEM